VRFVAAAAAALLCALGCAPATGARRLPASVVRAARFEASRGADEDGARFVTRALQRAGLRFGTDGSVAALYGYMSTAQTLVAPADARPGDVVFFDVSGVAPELACADHAGVVERVEPDDGVIVFLEARGGRVRESFVDARQPALRRDGRGRIHNSFLRPMRPDDPPGARHFAGQMLCALARVTHR
jgi:hypothetical protein